MKKSIFLICLITIIITWVSFYFSWWTYFLLDSIVVPSRGLYMSFLSEPIFYIAYRLLNFVLWYVIFSKIFFVGVLLSAGFLWYLFADFISKYLDLKHKNAKLIYVWLICFFMINPFLYERILTQLWVIYGVILVWYWTYFLLKNLLDYNTKNFLYSWLAFWLSISAMPHSVFMIFVSVVVLIALFYHSKKDFINFLYLWLIAIFLNLNWLIWWFLFHQQWAISWIKIIDNRNLQSFATHGLDWLSPEITSIYGYWFRWETYSYITSPAKLNPKRYMSAFFVCAVSMLWIWYLLTSKKTRKFGLFLLCVWTISLVLGVWIASKIWWQWVKYLYDYVPFYMGMREPQKWIWMLILIYWIWFWVWVNLIYNFVVNKYWIFKNLYIRYCLVFMLLFARVPWMLFAFRGQLFLWDYPKDYFQARDVISDKWLQKVLVLPWHSYVACDWTRWRVIANVMQEFMRPTSLVVADNIEIWNIYTNVESTQSKDVENFIKSKDLNHLKKNWFDAIINLKSCADFKNYEFVEKIDWLDKIFSWSRIDFYNIK